MGSPAGRIPGREACALVLPGHLAASLLAARRWRLPIPVALLAGVAPDLVDKFIFYVLRASHWTRVPAHSLLALLLSTVAVGALGRMVRSARGWWRAWFAGFGLHLLGDIVPGEGVLPWLWPLRSYAEIASPERPWFLGGGPVPWVTLALEIALVLIAVSVELARRRHAAASALPAED
ncbi:MAG: metal-dependent hydrolase [Anaerolineae bacterium]